MIGPAYEINRPEVAIQATNPVGTIATKIIGSGDIQTGVSGRGNSITVTPKDGKKALNFLIATYVHITACKASDWGTGSDFYASTYVSAIWPPTPAAMSLVEAKRAKWSRAL